MDNNCYPIRNKRKITKDKTVQKKKVYYTNAKEKVLQMKKVWADALLLPRQYKKLVKQKNYLRYKCMMQTKEN